MCIYGYVYLSYLGTQEMVMLCFQNKVVSKALQKALEKGEIADVSIPPQERKWKFPLRTFAEADAFNKEVNDPRTSDDQRLKVASEEYSFLCKKRVKMVQKT